MCTQSVVKALELVHGVESVVVSLSTNQAKVEFDQSMTSVDTLKEAIEDVGYDVVEAQILTSIVDASKPTTKGGSNVMDSPDRIDRMLHQQEEEVVNRKQAFVWSLLGTLPLACE